MNTIKKLQIQLTMKYKQFVIINKGLKMSVGKIAAMSCHASTLAILKQSKTWNGRRIIHKWLKEGECVIVLEAYNSSQMFGLQQYLNRKGIINHLYIDECLGEGQMGEPNALATGVVENFNFLDTLKLYSNGKRNRSK